MGTLVTKDNLPLQIDWYFPDAKYSWARDTWHYTWPSNAFPHSVSVHTECFGNNPTIKAEMRSWISCYGRGTVILDNVDKSYRVYTSAEREFHRGFPRPNIWTVFYFEDAESATMFRLKFATFVSNITDLHPTAGDEYEKTSYCKTH